MTRAGVRAKVGAMSDQTTAPPPPPPPPAQKGTGPLGIGGWIFAVIAVLLLLVGLLVVVVHATQRDSDGYYTSSNIAIRSAGAAVYADGLVLDSKSGADAVRDVLGDVRVRARTVNGAPVFVGIASEDDVDAYLEGVERSKVKEVNDDDDVTYREHTGPAVPATPPEQRFWKASASGAGRQTLKWKAEKGDFSIVVMNADGSKPVRAVVSVGAKAPAVLWIGIGVIVLALICAGAGTAMVVSDRRKRRRTAAAPA